MNQSRLSFSKALINSALTGYLLKGIQFLINLVTLPLIIDSLGKEQYGIYVLMAQTVSFLALSDFGVTNSIGRFVSRYKITESKERIYELVNTAFFLLAIAGLVIFAMTIGIAYWIPSWLNINPQFHTIARIIFVLNGSFLALLFPTGIGFGVLSGNQKYYIINLISIASALVQFGALLLFSYTQSLGLLPLTLIAASTTIATRILTAFFAHRSMKIFPLMLSKFSNNIMNDVLSLGSSSIVVTLSGTLISQGLVIAIGIILNTSSTGIYGVVLLITTNISYILTKMGQPLATIGSELDAQNRKVKLRKLTGYVMNISFVLSGLISVVLLFYVRPLLRLLLNQGWDEQDFNVASISIIIMCFSMTAGIPQFVSRVVLQGVGQHWKAGIAKAIISIVSFLVAIGLLIVTKSIIGAAIGWGLVWVMQGIYFPFQINKYLEQSMLQLLLRSYMQGALAMLANITIGIFFTKSLDITLPNIFAGIVVMCVGTFAIYYAFNYNQIKAAFFELRKNEIETVA